VQQKWRALTNALALCSGKPFQPSLIIGSMARAYPSGAPLGCSPLA